MATDQLTMLCDVFDGLIEAIEEADIEDLEHDYIECPTDERDDCFLCSARDIRDQARGGMHGSAQQ